MSYYSSSGHGNDVEGNIADHRQNQVHEQPQPPQQHDHAGDTLGPIEQAFVKVQEGVAVNAGWDGFADLHEAQAVAAGGENRLWVPNGTYDLGGNSLDLGGVSLIGQSRDGVIIENGRGEAIKDTGNLSNGNGGVRIENVTVRGDYGNYSIQIGYRTHVDNVRVESNNSGHGIGALFVDQVRVTNCTVDACSGDEIRIYNTDNSHVLGCTVTGAINDGGSNNSIPASGAGNVIIQP